jgi:hypothetical protein
MPNETKGGPREVFMEFWIIISLYVSAISVLALLFQYINYFFPDIANPYTYSDTAVKWAVAILVAILPTHVWMFRSAQRDYENNPARREGRLRKWLLYFTLFVAGITFVIDAATLVFYFLDGELSVRFILKVLSVALVAGGVFWYYLQDLRRGEKTMPQNVSLTLKAALAAVVVVIVAAFFISGSPFAARTEKIDERRVSDLQQIQNQIVYGYWQPKSVLPNSLGDLKSDISGFEAPTDPETGAPYEYRRTSSTTFELCATFSAPSPKDADRYSYYPGPLGNENWMHGAGRTCFARTIDPELYPPTRKVPTAAPLD